MDEKYCASASISSVLFEMIFTERLIRETSNPPNFIPSQKNVNEQLTNLKRKDNEVTNIEKLNFRKITKSLVELGIINHEEKMEQDEFYSTIRNPVLHGLTSRLFMTFIGRAPQSTFEIDLKYDDIYKEAAKMLIEKIYSLMSNKTLVKG
ncbi:MAG: hypothetical protein JXQ96_16605 [Cyclobacteriaceae bacterium]